MPVRIESSIRFRVLPRWYQTLGAFAAVVIATLVGVIVGVSPGLLAKALLVPVAVIIGLVGLGFSVRTGHVILGEDGVSLVSPWANWYLPRARIRQARRTPQLDLELLLVSGETVRLKPHESEPDQVTLFVQALQDPPANSESVSSRFEYVESLLLNTPVEHLPFALEISTPKYRVPAFNPEDLWSVIRDPETAPEVRVAAVVALTPTLSDAERLALGEIASRTAHPHVREAAFSACCGRPSEALVGIAQASRRRPFRVPKELRANS